MLDALLDNLLESGLNNATEVILTGCSGVSYHYVHSRVSAECSTIILVFIVVIYSHMIHTAGGLATFIHADYVGAYLPQNIKYRAFADAG